MWKQPWGYIEGWTIAIGIFITGMILQFFSGKIDPESFRFPVNLIGGGIFLLCLLLFHLISRKNKSLRWFSGLAAGITALSSLLFIVIIMGLTRQFPHSLDLSQETGLVRSGLMQMTVSWPFMLLSLYMLWVLGLVILRRFSHFKWKDTGFILNHAGLFIAFFAAIMGSSDLQRLRMAVPLNDSEWRATNDKGEMVELPLAIELKSFTIDEYPPKLILLDNATGETVPPGKPKNVYVETVPLTVALMEWELEIVRFLPCAAAVVNKDTINFVEYHAEGSVPALYVKAINKTNGDRNEGWVSCGSYRFKFVALRLDDKVSLVMPNPEPKRYASDVTVYLQSEETKVATIEVNKPLSIAGWKIYQMSYDEVMGKWSRYSVFELIKDPWLPVVYAGIIMLLAGAVFLFISAPKKP